MRRNTNNGRLRNVVTDIAEHHRAGCRLSQYIKRIDNTCDGYFRAIASSLTNDYIAVGVVFVAIVLIHALQTRQLV